MKKFKEFLQHEQDSFHDVIVDATGVKPTNELLERYYEELPKWIKDTAINYGMNDTVFRDEVFTHLEEVGVYE